MKAIIIIFVSGVLAWAIFACGEDVSASYSAKIAAKTPEQQGKYLILIGGCNDCHTTGFAESGGQKPAESDWLTGSPVGFRGPWGTSYPSNLRLTVDSISEEAWVQMCRNRQALPPMPWPSLNKMDENDLRAIYAYLKSLGPKGIRAPLIVAPGVEPATPYFVFEPQHLERLGSIAQ